MVTGRVPGGAAAESHDSPPEAVFHAAPPAGVSVDEPGPERRVSGDRRPRRRTGPVRRSGRQIVCGEPVGADACSAVVSWAHGRRGLLGPFGPGRVRPCTSMAVTVPKCPTSLRRRTTAGASRRSWVAQAVEPVRTTSRPSAKDPGCRLGPPGADQPSHRPKTPCTRRSSSQPWSSTSRCSVVSSSCPGRRVGTRHPGRGDGESRRGRCVVRAVGSSARLSRFSRQVQPVVAVPGVPGRWGPSGRSGGRRLAVAHCSRTTSRSRPVVADAGQRGNIRRDGGQVTRTCSAPATRSASGPAGRCRAGEDVVEDQDRVVAVGTEYRTTPAASRGRRDQTPRGRRSP